MSQYADLVDTFEAFQHRYKWTQGETARNFLTVIGDLEWEVSDIDGVGAEDQESHEQDEYIIAKGYFSTIYD